MSPTDDDDEKSLLEAIKDSVGSYELHSQISHRIYPYTSYILKNVTAFRLDAWKLADSSIYENRMVDSEVTEFDFAKFDFSDIWNILKEVERANSAEIDGHKFGLSLMAILRKQVYSMNFLLVGTLAAFAVSHGVWLLVLRLICTNTDDEDITMVLKNVQGLFLTLSQNLRNPNIDCGLYFQLYISLLSSSTIRMPTANWESLGSLYSLIDVMLQVISVAHLFLKDVPKHTPTVLKDEFDCLVLLSIYWVTRSVLECSSQCNNLPKNGYVIQDSQKLTYVCDKLVSIKERLRKLDDEKISETYQIPSKEGNDNYYALMALFGLNGSKDLVLSHCSRKNIELSAVTLRKKTLVLIISRLDTASSVIFDLKDIYVQFMKTFQQADCEFIWIPIHNDPWTNSMEKQYQQLLQMMPWYTVKHPTFITEYSRKFIRDIWMFHRAPIAVVLDENGNVVCPNAIHLMYIWGTKAYPFTRMQERTLWNDETRFDCLVLGFEFESYISSKLDASKWVILYGGIDEEWIRKFNACIQEISVDSGKSLEIIYVRINANREKNPETISTILVDEPPNEFLHDLEKIYFWRRLENLVISRYRSINASEYSTDPIIREVEELLSYASADSWACLMTPSSNGLIIHGLGDLMLQAFLDYNMWIQHLHTKDFTKIFYNNVKRLRKSKLSDYPCSRIVLNIDNKDVFQSLKCPNCINLMEKRIQYSCCHAVDELKQLM